MHAKGPDRIFAPGPQLLNGLLALGGLFLAYRVGKGIVLDMKKESALRLADDSPQVQQALLIRDALNPSGISWLMALDQANVAKVLDLAAQITDLDRVAGAYRDLFGENIYRDLQNELSTLNYQKFLTIVSSNPAKVATGGALPAAVFAKAGTLLVAKRDVFVRSSPDASNHGAVYEIFSAPNIIRTAKAGGFIGYATGRQHYDAKNNVKFVQAAFAVKPESAPAAWKPKARQRFTFWVSASKTYVEQFDDYNRMWGAYPLTKNATGWMKPPNYFDKP
jgi:hypothetical protein